MSIAVFKGNASGTGTVTVETPNTNSDFTIALPSRACTLAFDGPAFSASMANNQSVTSGAWTRVNYNSEGFDTANCYDSTTNYRFTPNVAGYYQVNLALAISAASNVGGYGIAVFKNGSPEQYFYRTANTTYGTTDAYPSGSFLVYCNGSTDYLDAYGYASATTPSFVLSGTQTCFQAFLARAA